MSIVIVGAGPNLGAAIARRFGREGMPVGLSPATGTSSNSSPRSSQRRGSPPTSSPPTSATPSALSSAIGALADRLGPVEVLEYSPVPAGEFMQPVLETTVDDLRANLEFSVLGPVAAVTAVIDADARTWLGHPPVHHRRRGDQPQSAPRRRRDLVRRRGRLRPDAPRRPPRPRHPRRAHRGRRQHRARRRPPRPTRSPTSSGATTPAAPTSRSGSASNSRRGDALEPVEPPRLHVVERSPHCTDERARSPSEDVSRRAGSHFIAQLAT